jgi:hypothetical protein
MVGRFWKPFIGQALGREFDLVVLIGAADERAPIQWDNRMWLRKRGDKRSFRDHELNVVSFIPQGNFGTVP